VAFTVHFTIYQNNTFSDIVMSLVSGGILEKLAMAKEPRKQ
jgi:hypothetical protein